MKTINWSSQDEEENSAEDVFTNVDEDEVNLSFRDNEYEAVLLSFRSKNVGVRGSKKIVQSKINSKSERRDSMIRYIVDRLSSGQEDSIRVLQVMII